MVWEYQNIKIFLKKITLQIGWVGVFVIKIVKVLCSGHMLLIILTEKEMLEHFLKKNCKTKIKKNLELIKCILDGKDTLIHLIAG